MRIFKAIGTIIVAGAFLIGVPSAFAYTEVDVSSLSCDATGIISVTVAGWPTSTASGATALVRNRPTIETSYGSTNYVSGVNGVYDSSNWGVSGYLVAWSQYDSIFSDGMYLLRFDTEHGTLQEYAVIDESDHNCLVDASDTTSRIISTIPNISTYIATTSTTTIGLPISSDNNGVSPACSLYSDCSNGAGVATTTVNIIGYINEADFVFNESYVFVSIYNVKTGFINAVSQYLIPIPAFGIFDISTTTDYLFGGGNRMDSKIISRVLDVNDSWYCFFMDSCTTVDQKTLFATSTLFTIGDIPFTLKDQQNLLSYGTLDGVLDSLVDTGSTTAELIKQCNPFSNFNMGNCLYSIVLPSSADLNPIALQLKTTVLQSFPLGYVTRIIEIMSTSSPVMPPALVYTFGSSSPAVLQGKTYSMQIYDYIGSNSPLESIRADDGSNRNIWEIVDMPIKVLVAIMVLFVFLNDLLGIGIKKEQEFESRVDRKKKMFRDSTTDKINYNYKDNKWE